MGRKWSASDAGKRVDPVAGDDEPITLFGAWVGATDRGAAALRHALQLSVAVRTWHRVCPYLPREKRPDGSLVLWHPLGADWIRAQERVQYIMQDEPTYFTWDGTDPTLAMWSASASATEAWARGLPMEAGYRPVRESARQSQGPF